MTPKKPRVRCRQCQKPVSVGALSCRRCGVDHPGDNFLGRTIGGDILIEARIGSGSMGSVYKGTKLHINRPVAIKRFISADVTAFILDSFEREAKVLSRLRHPHIVSVLDSGRDEEGGLYLVLEFIPGQTLGELLQSVFPLPYERVLRIMVQLLTALEEAHSHNIIHRDLKPGNVLLEQVAGMNDFVKVVDFGIAKILPGHEGSLAAEGAASRQGLIKGTPLYMSPEQIKGQTVDQCSDVFSAGLLMFEMLTREVPHQCNGVYEVMRRRAKEPVQPPSRLKPDLSIPPALDRICLKSLALDKTKRYGSVVEMRREIQEALDELKVRRAPLAWIRKRIGHRGKGRDEKKDNRLTCTVLALHPVTGNASGGGDQTMAERQLIVEDYVTRFLEREGGVKLPSGGLGTRVAFKDQLGASTAARAAALALLLRFKIKRHFPFAKLAMGLSRGPIDLPEDLDNEVEVKGKALKEADALAAKAGPDKLLAQLSLKSALAEAFHVEVRGAAIRVEDAVLMGEKGGAGGRMDVSQPTFEDMVRAHSYDERTLGIEELDVDSIPGRLALQTAFDDALGALLSGRASPPLVLIGPPGAGRRFAASYLFGKASSMGVMSLWSRCDPACLDRPMRPLLEMAVKLLSTEGKRRGQAAEMPQGRADMTLMRKNGKGYGLEGGDVEAIVGQWVVGTQNDPYTSRLRASGGVSFARLSESLRRSPPEDRHLSFVAAFRRLLERVADSRGVVLIIEGIEHADAMTRACLPSLARLAETHPILIVLTAAPGWRGSPPPFVHVSVPPLGKEDLDVVWEALLEENAGLNRDLLENLDKDALMSASEGSPLFLNRWLGAPTTSTFPQGIRDLVHGQLLMMPDDQQQALLTASALGATFEVEVLHRAVPASHEATDSLSMPPWPWVLPCRGEPHLWRFSSPLLRKIIYEHIPETTHRSIHRRIFKALAEMSSTPLRVYTMARQANRAGLKSQTSLLAETMGDRFALSGDTLRAAEWYLRARKFIAHRRESRPGARWLNEELILKAALTLKASGRPENALSVLRKANFKGPASQIRGEILLSQMSLEAGDLKGATKALRRARAVPLESPPLAFALLAMRAEISALEGHTSRAHDASTKALKRLKTAELEMPPEMAHLQWRLWLIKGNAEASGGRTGVALESFGRALYEARRLKDNMGLFEVLGHVATWSLRKERGESLRDLCLELMEDGRLEPGERQTTMLWRILGHSMWVSGDRQGAKEAFGCAIEVAQAHGWEGLVKRLRRLERHGPSSITPEPSEWMLRSLEK